MNENLIANVQISNAPVSQTTDAFNYLADQLEVLHDNVYVLHNRIEPILGPDYRKDQSEQAETLPDQERSQLVSHIRREALRVQEINKKLSDILNRVEI